MANTYQFGLPLIQPAQAQKHVTVNEAVARLDAVAQLRVVSTIVATPPATALDGECYVVPSGATGDWAGRAGEVAVFSNGGWVFLSPKTGWRGWDESSGTEIVHDGGAWVQASVIGPGGAATAQRIVELDHVLAGGGAAEATAALIPSHAQVIGVTARVVADITGSGVSSWSLGVSGDPARYASGLGLTKNSWARGLSGAPVTYYADTALEITADAGSFTAGTIRLAAHVVELTPPRAV